MEIDLDNLVFDGLEEAQERNAERLEDADKKAQEIIADNDCGAPAKSDFRTGAMPVFFYLLAMPSRLATYRIAFTHC